MMMGALGPSNHVLQRDAVDFSGCRQEAASTLDVRMKS
jgi:hypothetical protein